MRHRVGMGELRVSKYGGDILVASSLGSCIGLAVYDPVAGVAGLLHAMLPLSDVNREKAIRQPAMFVDTDVVTLLRRVFGLGATRANLVAKVAGGASVLDIHMHFNIGKRNYTVVRKILWKNDILIASECVGGTDTRTLTINVGTGETHVQSGDQTILL